jgi:GT2 family glycosyltransferase
MTLNRDHDVVILNSDTEVYGDWLARLRAAAYSADDIGTVTPLSNSASIASYPRNEELDIDSEAAAARDSLTARLNAGSVIDVPTGVGFCMFIRRDCLDQTGIFDAVTFGRGYGEENDFCMRAAEIGWRHVLAADIYVRHIGSRSFGGGRAALAERNLRLLCLRHPGYLDAVRRFIETDPVHAVRRRLDEARLVAQTGRWVLIVTHSLPGGVRRAIDARLEELRAEGLKPILLQPDGDDGDRCRLDPGEHGLEDLFYDLGDRAAADMDTPVALLRRLDLAHVEIHHFMGLPGSLIDQILGLGRPVDFRVHDYILFCPRISLMGENDEYCGEPDLAACERCVAQNGSELTEDIPVAALRERSLKWLVAAREVIAPTSGVATRLKRHFPLRTIRIAPLEPTPRVLPHLQLRVERLKIAILGALGNHKGYKRLLAMAEDAATRQLPMEFVVIGYTENDRTLTATGCVFVTGEYQEAELDDLIDRESPNLLLFPSVVPETWCYTLTHALGAGLPIAAFDLGAIADRLRASEAEKLLFPLSVSTQELNDSLLKWFGLSPTRRDSRELIPPQVKPAGLLPAPSYSFDDPAPWEWALSSRMSMAQKPSGISATVEVLPLVKGLYLFSVKTAFSHRMGDDSELVLPALQVGVGPGTAAGNIEFMYGPRTESAWLYEPRDHIVVKVKEPSTLVLLTSVFAEGMKPLEIEVKRLDSPAPVRQATASAPSEPQSPFLGKSGRGLAAPVAAGPVPPLNIPAEAVPLKITAHIQNRGDVDFSGPQWAGLVGQRLALESFTILPTEDIQPTMIEYKAVTATGIETPWITGGQPCGTRGLGVAIVGFAVRIKPQTGASAFNCEYGAVLVSGTTIGPGRNGAPIRSTDTANPIEGIWVSITERHDVSATAAEAVVALAASEPAAPPCKAPPRKASGPRFSAFREPVEE